MSTSDDQPMPVDLSKVKLTVLNLDNDQDSENFDYDDEHPFMKEYTFTVEDPNPPSPPAGVKYTPPPEPLVEIIVKTLDRDLIHPGDFYLSMDEVSDVRELCCLDPYSLVLHIFVNPGSPFSGHLDFEFKKQGVISFWRSVGFRRVAGTWFFGYARNQKHPMRSLMAEDDAGESQHKGFTASDTLDSILSLVNS